MSKNSKGKCIQGIYPVCEGEAAPGFAGNYQDVCYNEKSSKFQAMVAADGLNAAAKSIKDYRNVGANLVFALKWRGEHQVRPYEKIDAR